jgi:hypothetical protein
LQVLQQLGGQPFTMGPPQGTAAEWQRWQQAFDLYESATASGNLDLAASLLPFVANSPASWDKEMQRRAQGLSPQ